METIITREVDRLRDGTRVVRTFFINSDQTNWMTKAHSYFTKDEKKLAKLKHKNDLNRSIVF